MKLTTGRLEAEILQNGREHRVTLSGQLDERANLNDVAKGIKEQASFDLAHVSFINSIGVREWIRMLRTLKDRNVAVALRRCSEAMVQQMNMIVETVGHAKVESLHMPYACDKCGNEASMCIEVRDHAAALAKMQPPPQKCPECSGEMQFSEIPARYLLFLQGGERA
jgi:hypothetical protein